MELSQSFSSHPLLKAYHFANLHFQGTAYYFISYEIGVPYLYLSDTWLVYHDYAVNLIICPVGFPPVMWSSLNPSALCISLQPLIQLWFNIFVCPTKCGDAHRKHTWICEVHKTYSTSHRIIKVCENFLTWLRNSPYDEIFAYLSNAKGFVTSP